MSLRLLEMKDDPAIVVSSAIPPRRARGTPVRASVVVCGAREAAVALVIAEASLALSVVVGALVAAEGEDVLTDGEGCEDVGESEGVGVEQGEGSVISSTCAPLARGATVISAVHESTESFEF